MRTTVRLDPEVAGALELLDGFDQQDRSSKPDDHTDEDDEARS